MAETWDRAQLIADGFQQVYVELDWWDGPRAGMVDLDGVPHYFERVDAPDGERLDEYLVWPAEPHAVMLERESWAVFVRWNQLYEAGEASVDTHPARGVDPRYEELTAALVPQRRVPAAARRLVAEWRFDDGGRYRTDGTCNWVRWSSPT
ncbi:hypothetical protein [Kribbella sindirgiensis]|uniref:Uncharacterized protein n=1 Tax=Kribbella sindirgiensis TaxID=1124744 RepID=A0A4R0IP27_9ACTN|nr:hypothetical protein [Kribbella sindirgiensis]TCC34667.1 hypothetical protein E0H50_12170 [Kribbella sindirgiensis]